MSVIEQALLNLGDTAHRRRRELAVRGPEQDEGRLPRLPRRELPRSAEPEPAAASATQSLLLARCIGAPRCARLVDDLVPRFEPYARAGVPELLQLAAA